VFWQGAAIVTLLGTTVVLLIKKTRAGFLFAAFFIIISPSSSFVPLVAQTIAEHRMHLPLACVIALVFIGLFSRMPRFASALGVIVALLAGAGTIIRNQAYASDLAIWQDTVKKNPLNARALYNVAHCLELSGRPEEAELYYAEVIRLKSPLFAEAATGFARCCDMLGAPEKGIKVLESVHERELGTHHTYFTLGALYEQDNRTGEALPLYKKAMEINPSQPIYLNHYFDALLKTKDFATAAGICATLEKHAPNSPKTLMAKGDLYLAQGKHDEALADYNKALALLSKPSWEIYEKLASFYEKTGDPEKAAHYKEISDSLYNAAPRVMDGRH
jgi:tetratricopeptide (TPR) repeat protein